MPSSLKRESRVWQTNGRTDRRTDRRTNRLLDSKCRASLRCAAENDE